MFWLSYRIYGNGHEGTKAQRNTKKKKIGRELHEYSRMENLISVHSRNPWLLNFFVLLRAFASLWLNYSCKFDKLPDCYLKLMGMKNYSLLNFIFCSLFFALTNKTFAQNSPR